MVNLRCWTLFIGLSIIYRVINNVCTLMCTNLNTENYTAFGYILGLKTEIHYFDSENRSCSIICNDKSILLNFYDVKGRKKKYKLGLLIVRVFRWLCLSQNPASTMMFTRLERRLTRFLA